MHLRPVSMHKKYVIDMHLSLPSRQAHGIFTRRRVGKGWHQSQRTLSGIHDDQINGKHLGQQSRAQGQHLHKGPFLALSILIAVQRSWQELTPMGRVSVFRYQRGV